MNEPLKVVLLWHMHQPSYDDPDTGHALMPWVRLHAMKDYYDMAKVIEDVPGAKAVINVVPSLWDQLLNLSEGSWLDEHEILARRPARDLSDDERRYLAKQFFAAHPDSMIEPYPRYVELKNRYDGPQGEKRILKAPARDLRDIQVWFHIAWCGHTLKHDPLVAGLIDKGRHFKEDEKLALLDRIRAFLNEIPTLYRKLSDSGQIEVSTTPYYHPILPLLIDPESALVACPGMNLPRGRRSLAADAERQIDLAVQRHEKLFGHPPAGFWPSEGSVSPEVAKLMASKGVRWIATDEEVLKASLRKDTLEAADKYRIYAFGGTHLFFRDHGLSDGIGFEYQKLDTEEAVETFIGHLRTIHQSLPDEPGFVVPVILDGENCWEFYSEQGRPFLKQLYTELVKDPSLELGTCSEALDLDVPIRKLDYLHSGSWIFANFTTWIGDPVKNRAWELLYQARQIAEETLAAGNLNDEAETALWEHILAAEGSDWFWWFGEGHTTAFDPMFDALFRKRLAAIYRSCNQELPEALLRPVDHRWATETPYILPTYSLHPHIDGRITSYYEWLSAGACYPAAGAMQRIATMMTKLSFGFDDRHLYLRIEGPAIEQLKSGEARLSLFFEVPSNNSKTLSLSLPQEEQIETPEGFHYAMDQVIEAALPFAALSTELKPGEPIEFYVALERNNREVERLPDGAPIVLPFPSETFDDENWQV